MVHGSRNRLGSIPVHFYVIKSSSCKCSAHMIVRNQIPSFLRPPSVASARPSVRPSVRDLCMSWFPFNDFSIIRRLRSRNGGARTRSHPSTSGHRVSGERRYCWLTACLSSRSRSAAGFWSKNHLFLANSPIEEELYSLCTALRDSNIMGLTIRGVPRQRLSC